MTLPMLSTPEAMLEWLGSSQTPDEVAEKLRWLEVKGVQSEPCRCPVSVALVMAGAANPIVGFGETSWWTSAGDQAITDTPPVVIRFISAFDGYECAYPDLILEQAS